jgi:hypothetical protein
MRYAIKLGSNIFLFGVTILSVALIAVYSIGY